MEPGLRLTERYRLVGRLDGGDPGEVWRAWDEALNRPVAVRLAGPGHIDGAGGDGAPGDALRERVVAAVRITHPAFVTVYDCDHSEDCGVAYVVTALPDGQSLARRLADGPLPPVEALDCCAQVAEALAAAHAAGLAHGALRPDKIFLTVDGVRIVDLGIAAPDDPAGAAAGDMAAFGTLLATCLGVASPADVPGMPDEVTALCAQCRAPDPGDRPEASQAVAILDRAEAAAEPAGPPGPDDETLVHDGLGPPGAPGPPEPPGPPGSQGEQVPGRRAADLKGEARPVFRVALTVTVLAASLATILVLANRGTMNDAFSGGTQVPAPSNPPSSSSATPAPRAMSPVPEPAVYATLGRLQPIVDSGQASGAIRSDVAVDLNNSIATLRNALAAGRTAEASDQLRLLREKIDTRERERALDGRVADRMNDVLATTAP